MPVVLPDFGARQGAACIAMGSEFEKRQITAAQGCGYFVSIINTDVPNVLSVENSRGMLNDLAWQNPDDSPPDWYTGDYWGQEEDASRA